MFPPDEPGAGLDTRASDGAADYAEHASAPSAEPRAAPSPENKPAAEPVLSTTEQERFAYSITENCKTHAEWLNVIRFGLPTLLSEPGLLLELIVAEATRQQWR